MHHQTETINTPANSAPRFAISENVARHRGSCVYAVLFSDGWVKVGRGRNGEARIGSHAGVSAMRNATVVRSVVSGRIVDSRSAEKELIAYCSENGRSVHGREWFSDIDFETLEGIITKQFSDSSDEQFAVAAERSDVAAKKLVDAIFSIGAPSPSEAKRAAEEAARWAESLTHARILDRLYRDDAYGGWLFEISASGMTNFFNYAALTVNTLDEGEIADLFYCASTNPGEALEQITGTARALIAAYAAEVNQ